MQQNYNEQNCEHNQKENVLWWENAQKTSQPFTTIHVKEPRQHCYAGCCHDFFNDGVENFCSLSVVKTAYTWVRDLGTISLSASNGKKRMDNLILDHHRRSYCHCIVKWQDRECLSAASTSIASMASTKPNYHNFKLKKRNSLYTFDNINKNKLNKRLTDTIIIIFTSWVGSQTHVLVKTRENINKNWYKIQVVVGYLKCAS